MTDRQLEVFIPLKFHRRGARWVLEGDHPVHDVTLLKGLARGFYWQQLIDNGVLKSGAAIARAEGLHPTIVSDHMRLCLLAPDIIEQMMAGQQPRRMRLTWLLHHRLPTDWAAQRQIIKQFE